MKKRLIALLLLLVLVLTACASDTSLTKPGKEPKNIGHTQETRETQESPATQAAGTSDDMTEAPTVATEVPDSSDADIGVADANSYTNKSLGIAASFPESWYLYNETDIASLNKLDEATFDRAAVADAIEAGQSVVIFCASEPASLSSVRISLSKNPLPGADADALVNHFAPQVKEQYAQSGLQNITCEPFDADFCGEDHVVLSVSGDANGMQLYETYMYLTYGDSLYTMIISTGQEGMVAEALSLFETLR